MPERLDVLHTNVEKSAKVDATTDCWQVPARTLVAVGEQGSTIPTTVFLTITKYIKRGIGLGCVLRRAAVTIPATAYTTIRQ